ncbi:MAG: SGNH/GDSL hydrolase family protein [Chloroflexota bacterium]
MKVIIRSIIIFGAVLMLSACGKAGVEASTDLVGTLENSETIKPETTANPVQLFTPKPTTSLVTGIPVDEIGNWKDLPVVPDQISLRSQEIYRLGQDLQNNPYAFSVVGDCESSPSWFLGDFDRGKSFYSLGEYEDLELVINAFQGSFERKNLAVGNGFNTAAVLSPLWADPESCLRGETPLDCEIRLHRPAFVFILLGTNDIYQLDSFEINMRKILDSLVGRGILPILATKADDLEGGNKINAIIANLALEYDIPLWNFWRVVQPLPHQGLQSDGAHLTWAKNNFDDPSAMQNAWPWRNLTALQVLDKVWWMIQESGY